MAPRRPPSRSAGSRPTAQEIREELAEVARLVEDLQLDAGAPTTPTAVPLPTTPAVTPSEPPKVPRSPRRAAERRGTGASAARRGSLAAAPPGALAAARVAADPAGWIDPMRAGAAVAEPEPVETVPEGAPDTAPAPPSAPEPSPVDEPPAGDGRAPRPWSLWAAMEPVHPVGPSIPRPAEVAEDGGHSWALTAVVLMALLVAVAVVVASHLRLGSTSSPAFTINGLSPQRDAGVPVDLPFGHFPAGVSHVDVDCQYVGATVGTVVDFSITLQPSTPGAAPRPLAPLSHTFTSADGDSGTITVTITASGSGFLPGNYTVDATRQGQDLRSTQFTVEPAAAHP